MIPTGIYDTHGDLLCKAGPCRVHLRTRDEACRDAAAFRDPGHGTDVCARNRRGYSQPVLSDGRGRPCTRRSRGANLGCWSSAYLLFIKALTRQQRWIAVAAVAVAWGLSSKGNLGLLFIAAPWAPLGGKAPERPDPRALLEYVVLVAGLTGPPPIPGPVTALYYI